MIIYFIVITNIYSCILRKREHCLDGKIFKTRKYPDYLIKPNVNSEIVLKNKSTNIEIIDLTDDQSECKRSKQDLPQTDQTIFNEHNLHENITENIHLSDKKMGKLIGIYHNFDRVKLQEIYRKFICGDMENIYEIIELFLKKFVKKSYLNYYLFRIKCLSENFSLLHKNENRFTKNYSIFDLIDQKFLMILEKLVNTFGSNEEFTNEKYEEFIQQLYGHLTSIENFSDFNGYLMSICFDEKRHLYFYELMKCFKYFETFPELMILGGIESYKSTNNIIIPIHLLNLLLNGRKNIKKVKTIVLFLIKKAFAGSNRSELCFFSIKNLHIKCLNDIKKLHEKDLSFFLWEMNSKRRHEVKNKQGDKTVLYCSYTDEIHFKSVLLIFLYQQLIFLQNKNADEEMIKKYINLTDRIISFKEFCPGCIWDKFHDLFKE